LLAATVSNAGGLGFFGANDLAPEDITKVAAEICQLTDKPFGMNLWVSTFPGGDTLEQAAYERVMALLAPYYEELGVKPPPAPTAKAPNFDDQVAALLEASPAVFSFVFGIPSPESTRAFRGRTRDGLRAAFTIASPGR
jgi:nitronate monooxygenase